MWNRLPPLCIAQINGNLLTPFELDKGKFSFSRRHHLYYVSVEGVMQDTSTGDFEALDNFHGFMRKFQLQNGVPEFYEGSCCHSRPEGWGRQIS